MLRNEKIKKLANLSLSALGIYLKINCTTQNWAKFHGPLEFSIVFLSHFIAACILVTHWNKKDILYARFFCLR